MVNEKQTDSHSESIKNLKKSLNISVIENFQNQSVWRYEENQMAQNISRLKEINLNTFRQKSHSPKKLIIKPAVSDVIFLVIAIEQRYTSWSWVL
jgi:hypothetical protein